MRLFINIITLIIFSLSVYGGSAAQTGEDYPDYSETSTEELQRRYKTGDVHAGFTLGYNYFFDEDGNLKDNASNVDKGLLYLNTAHNNGHISANSVLSMIYLNGLFNVKQDIELGHNYSLEAAKFGSAVGKLNYGVNNLNSADQDVAKRAHDYLLEIVTEDFYGGTASEYLANLYYFGSDVYEADYESARAFAEACVVFGDSQGDCEYILARDYQNGWGGDADKKRSVELFFLGAERGNARSMWYAGMHELNGDQVTKNEVKAFKWIKKAAGLDDEQAMISLGVMYALGQGTAIDHDKAYASYGRAAALKSAHGLRGQAAMYCLGEGREKNNAICKAGLFFAAKHGDDQAPLLLNDYFKRSFEDINVSRLTETKFWSEKYPWVLDPREH